MLNKKLFYQLCQQYNVKLTNKTTTPVIQNASSTYPITKDNVNTHIL